MLPKTGKWLGKRGKHTPTGQPDFVALNCASGLVCFWDGRKIVPTPQEHVKLSGESEMLQKYFNF